MPVSHFVVNLVIRKKDKILLESRNDSGSVWKFPGGHVESSENVLETCIREAEEELGISIKLFSSLKLPKDPNSKLMFVPPPEVLFIEKKDQDSNLPSPHTHSGLVFFAITEDEPLPHEKQVIKWFGIEDLKIEKNIIEQFREVALQALMTKIEAVR